MSGLILPSRRLFLGGLIAAPAVIAANKLMPVKSIITADDVDLATGKSGWVLIMENNRPVWGRREVLERFHFENAVAYVDKPKPDFASRIIKEVLLPERINYKTVHAGTELLRIHPGTIIA